MLGIVGRTFLMERDVVAIAIVIVMVAMATAAVEGGSTDKELADIANVWQERTRLIKTLPR